MLWTVFVVLLALWAIGVIGSYTVGGYLHVLLALALVTLLIQALTTAPGAANFGREALMDKDTVKGKMKDVGGRVERQAGEWTGDEEMQSEGTAKQAEGKVQNAWGKVKDFGRDVKRDADRKIDKNKKKDAA